MTNNERNREIGRRIRTRRLELGIMQSGLARRMGLGLHAIKDIEGGTRKVSLDEAVKFAILLDVDLTWLAGVTAAQRAPGS